jgi:excisionase family DNA binding protein
MLGLVIPETEWASTLPAEQIPAALSKLAALQSALAARLLAEQMEPRDSADALLDAKEMAALLKCHESWVRSAARHGKIPFVPVGRYMRFKPAEVQAVVASSRHLT